ncbi:hypothetical protein AB0K21_15890 [Streptosporangium sp. NPDC049248]|uniref:hypothetical protein n=1 Tax=Streptosporangium sp. NPDC049248 TaxID=3155651 RepID=UPI00342979A5
MTQQTMRAAHPVTCLIGGLFLAAFAAVATGAGAPWANLVFVSGVVIIWAWLSALSLHLYRHAAPRHA